MACNSEFRPDTPKTTYRSETCNGLIEFRRAIWRGVRCHTRRTVSAGAGAEQRAEVEQLRAGQAEQGREAERTCADALCDRLKVLQVAADAHDAAIEHTAAGRVLHSHHSQRVAPQPLGGDGPSPPRPMTLHRSQRAHPPQRADATSLTIIAAILLCDSASSSAADLNGRRSPVHRNCTRSSGTLLA
jgi:hypothetical protein